MVSLDAVGNTTKAVTKGFAIGSAVIAAVALFASYIETAANETLPVEVVEGLNQTARGVFDAIPINVADPKVFIGLLLGGSISFLFSSLAIRAVQRTAGVVVQEVRDQFADGKIMSGERLPDYGPVIDICTKASLRELVTPALLAVLTPVIIGFGIGYLALGAFLAAVILTGQLMANYLSNAGGAWDNAKKYIEDGHEGGKGSDAHKAAVIGDTVGDPFKDTAGPALNPLIKVMNLVSLLILPAIISLSNIDEDNPVVSTPTGAGLAIAGVSIVVLIVAVLYSKRDTEALMEADPRRLRSTHSDHCESVLVNFLRTRVRKKFTRTLQSAPVVGAGQSVSDRAASRMARPSRTTSSGALHGGTTWMRLLAIIGHMPFALHSAATRPMVAASSGARVA